MYIKGGRRLEEKGTGPDAQLVAVYPEADSRGSHCPNLEVEKDQRKQGQTLAEEGPEKFTLQDCLGSVPSSSTTVSKPGRKKGGREKERGFPINRHPSQMRALFSPPPHVTPEIPLQLGGGRGRREA